MVDAGITSTILMRRILFWGVPGVLIAALAWSVLPRGGTPKEAARPSAGMGQDASSVPPAPESGTPYGTIQAGNLVGTDDRGRTRWKIAATHVSLEEGTRVVLLRGIRATFYDPDGTTMAVTGARGRYDVQSGQVGLEGNVHGISSIGREVFADRLDYSPTLGTITGTGHVRVIEEHVIMYADRMISSTTLRRTRFFGHVRMAGR
ncbi:MAG TPA: LPS export ABC transporter periplasmic protein LptC [bacterium]|nr:LPS export ABC transporter periplasmic protein LptC [bacterium]